MIDPEPRPQGLGAEEERLLLDLAALTMGRLDLRRAEAAHATSQARFLSIAASLPEAVVCACTAGRITFWNAAAEGLFGWPAAEALGLPLSILIPEPQRAAHEAGLARIAAGGPGRLFGQRVELTAQRRDGALFPVELSFSTWEDGTGAGFGAVIRDLTERRRYEARLRHLADHDGLTGLPNRALLHRRLEHAASEAARGTRPAALLLVDLDHFKDVNDLLGHSAGDRMLVEAAARLRACAREGDTVARLGGDEFALLLPGLGEPAAAAAVADRVVAALEKPFWLDVRLVHAGASVGVALAGRDGTEADEILAAADLALYRAKGEGRGCHRFFQPELRREVEVRRALEAELQQAVARDELVLRYQPQVRLRDGVVTGVEALLRWNHPARGLLPPAAFLDVLDGGSLAVGVGEWVLRTACRQARAWLDQGLPPIRMGVNLSAAQFRTRDLAATIAAVLAETGLPPAQLEVEITENILLKREMEVAGALRRIRALGVSVAFDDFGTGYASLSHLQQHALDRIKIDRSFVRDIGARADGATIARSIIALGKSLGIQVIAEGIEAADQEAFLRQHGCDEAQGYRYGRPITAGSVARLLRRCGNAGGRR